MTIVETAQDALDRGLGVIRKNYESTAAKGPADARSRSRRAWACSRPRSSFDDLADCDLVIEAVFENMDVKKEIFGKLDKIAKPGAILASNTSYLNIDEIAAATKPAGGRARPALLLAGQRDEAAGSRARREDRAGRARHRDAAREEDRQGRGRWSASATASSATAC